MDLVVLLVLIVLVIFLFKDVKWIAYLMGIIEIFLRIVHYIGDHLGSPDLNKLINKNLPESIFNVIGKYTKGIVYDVLAWILVGIFIMFLVYLIKYFIRKK